MIRTTKALAGAAVWLLLCAPGARADIIGFNGGAGYTVNWFNAQGNVFVPTFSGPGGNTVQMTTSAFGIATSVFYNTRQNVSQFTAQFTYQTTGGGDGFAFVVQNDPRGPSARAGGGGNLGYGNLEGFSDITPIAPSAAVLFNIWTGHPQGTEFVTDGTIDFAYSSVAPVTLDNNVPVQVALAYDGTNLTETLTQGGNVFSHTYAGLNLPGILGTDNAFVGFSGGAGGVDSNQFVSAFSFSSPAAVATPEPASLVLWGLGAAGLMLASARKRRPRTFEKR
jgi:hypothetical protein